MHAHPAPNLASPNLSGMLKLIDLIDMQIVRYLGSGGAPLGVQRIERELSI
jgi:hypothetical protein